MNCSYSGNWLKYGIIPPIVSSNSARKSSNDIQTIRKRCSVSIMSGQNEQNLGIINLSFCKPRDNTDVKLVDFYGNE